MAKYNTFLRDLYDKKERKKSSMDQMTIIYILLAVIAVLAISIIAIIVMKNKQIKKAKRSQRISPGSVRKNVIWLDPKDPIFANEGDNEPIFTVEQLIQCNLPESKFLEVTVPFHAVNDRGRLQILTESGYVWLEPINKLSSYTVTLTSQQ